MVFVDYTEINDDNNNAKVEQWLTLQYFRENAAQWIYQMK